MIKAPEKLPEITAADLDKFESMDGDQLLTQVTEFIGRYLQCTDHQRTVLALWVLHTHCLPAAQVTPYLAIQSAEKQSGKTLCLQLLNLLCDAPALTAGFTANTLTRRIDGPISTILLDECQATVGTRNRSKGPTLRAILSSGFHCGPGYTDATHERNAFAPKAFAGMGQLPEALADRSIPIILKPLKRVAQPANGGKPVERFDLRRAAKEARPIEELLHIWTEETCLDLEEKPVYAAEDFPPGLSPRRQDIIEPLLLLADYIGGAWPKRIREALNAVFNQEAAFNLAQSLQLLADIRDCFAWYSYPARLSSAALVSWMQNRPSRPWDGEGPLSARVIAHLLTPFDICPRVQRIGEEDPARGYRLEDFLPHWKTYLAFTMTVSSGPQPPGSPARAGVARDGVEAPSAASDVTDNQQSGISNNHAVCNAVTDSRAVSKSPASDQAEALTSSLETPTFDQGEADISCLQSNAVTKAASASAVSKSESSNSTAAVVTHAGHSRITSNDTGCNAVTDSRAIPALVEQTEEFPHASTFVIPEATGNGFHNTFQQGAV